MQEGKKKVEVTGSTRYHDTLSNEIGSDGTSYYIDGLIHSVFVKSLALSEFNDSVAQTHTIHSNIIEVHPVGVHW